jgi:hypothetical protein
MMTALAIARPWVLVTGILLAIAVVLFLIDRVFNWLGKNAGRYMRNDKAVTGGMRNVLGVFEEIVHPEIRHVHEEQEQRKAETGQTDPSDR